MEIVLPIIVVVALVVVAVVVVRSRRGGGGGPARPARSPGKPHVGGSAGGFRAEGLGAKVRGLFTTPGSDGWSELETLLLKADVGPRGAADLVARVRQGGADDPAGALAREIVEVLGPDQPLRLSDDRLAVIVVVGVNGSGKTTTIGKLAGLLVAGGNDVSIAGADTFRAAAGEQLEVWAARSGAHLITQERGADPSAVAFDAVRSALARGSDVLIVDTAGRLHTAVPLMDELRKVKRVIEKAGGVVDETLLVLDAQTGQNGIAQARAFTGAVDVSGVVLTKTDGSAKGGIVLAVREELGVPVRFVGVGEQAGDLVAFSAEAFADRLVG